MRYTVVWHAAVLDDLASAWVRAPNRQAITDAADWIDRELAVNPESKGEEFYGDRYLEAYPLAVVYCVDQENRLVKVNQLWCRV